MGLLLEADYANLWASLVPILFQQALFFCKVHNVTVAFEKKCTGLLYDHIGLEK